MKLENYSLLTHNTFGMDVKADYFIEYSSQDELMGLIANGEIASPFLHIGSGSNLLFTKDFNGTVLHSAIKGIEVVQAEADRVTLRIGAGELWDDVVEYCVAHNLYGVENLSLIPGEAGSAAVQNIGAYGVEIKDVMVGVDVVDVTVNEMRFLSCEELRYAYRYSMLKENKQFVVTSVLLSLSSKEWFKLEYGALRSEVEARAEDGKITLRDVRNAVIAIRKGKLPEPSELGNAGSFFQNPVVDVEVFRRLQKEYPAMPHYIVSDSLVKIPAGWLIEQCGWKGKSLGRAGVYSKQALVLVNLGGATGSEVVALCNTVRGAVKDKFGVEIYPEVNIF